MHETFSRLMNAIRSVWVSIDTQAVAVEITWFSGAAPLSLVAIEQQTFVRYLRRSTRLNVCVVPRDTATRWKWRVLGPVDAHVVVDGVASRSGTGAVASTELVFSVRRGEFDGNDLVVRSLAAD